MNAANAGKWAAVALFSFVAVLILISAVAEFSKQHDRTAREIAPDQFDVMWEATGPEAQWVDPASMTDASAALAGGEEWTWRQVDKGSGRVQYEITAERVDPEEGGRILLTKPRARIYLGQRVVRVSAMSGELVKPPDAEPESGKLGGGVVMELFDVGADEGQAADLDALTPVGTLRTDSLSFESALGQVTTEDEIDVESEGLSFHGRGLTLRVGELERGHRYRLNLLRIEESGGLRVLPTAFERTHEDGAKGDEAPRSKSADSDEQSGQAAPTADFYRATIQGDVDVAQGERRVTAERLTVFAKLLGGKLAPGAIRKLALPAEEKPKAETKPRTFEGTWSESFAGSRTREAAQPQDVTLTWSGPLEIRPEKTEPAELARDDVLVWFASPKRNVVEIRDAETGAAARCASLMYALTTARLMLSGVGPASADVRLSAPGVGEVLADDLEVDLADLPRGVVRMPSGGVARAAGGTESENPGTIRWRESSEITFELERRGGDLAVAARSVAMRGDVHAAEGDNRISADSIQAEFRPRQGEPGVPENALSRLHLKGDVRGASEDGGTLSADEAEVEFGGPASKPIPLEARAHGSVRVDRAGDWLTAEHVDAHFATDQSGRLRVSKLDADTGVALGSARGLGATTEQLSADLDHQIVELTGDGSELSYEHAGTRYALHSASMRLDGNTRRLVSFGRGDATYRLSGTEGVEDSGRMEWSGGMYYDDIAGTADMMGDVVASRVPGPLERQHAEAGHVRVSITPWSSEDGDDVEQRRLLAIDLEGADDAQASLELRRYRAGGPDEAELETLVALRSDTIGFDAVDQVLSAPQAGLLLVEDRRKGNVKEGAATSDVGKETEVRGTTAFEWKDGLTFHRATGEAVMKRDVRVRHMGLETGRLTQLECESLHAHFRKPGQEKPGASPLLSVNATDAVYLHHGTIEVVCDALAFDAVKEQIEASAGDGNRVTVLDSADGRHFSASTIEVDLRTGQWRAVKAAGIGLSR